MGKGCDAFGDTTIERGGGVVFVAMLGTPGTCAIIEGWAHFGIAGWFREMADAVAPSFLGFEFAAPFPMLYVFFDEREADLRDVRPFLQTFGLEGNVFVDVAVDDLPHATFASTPSLWSLLETPPRSRRGYKRA